MQDPDSAPLFSPLRLKNIQLGNRFIVPSMQRGMASGGTPTAVMRHYLASRIRGGFALVVSEACAIEHDVATKQHTATHMTTRTSSAWAEVIADVHEAGGHMFIQLWHEGATRRFDDGADRPSVSPSGLIRDGVPNGRAASLEDLASLRDAYAHSARIAKQAGADGIELHACHGYLLDQFLWAKTNLRQDVYGGSSLKDRLRFPVEVVEAVRAAVGEEMPISIRLSQWKEADFEAQTFAGAEDVELVVRTFTDAGIDMFHISQRRFYQAAWKGDDRSLAGWFKTFTDKPVAVSGSVGLDTELRDYVFGNGSSRVTARESVAELIRRFGRNEFDIVSVGRASIGDGDWVRKIREGRYGDIRPFDRTDLSSVKWDRHAFEVGGIDDLQSQHDV